VSEVIEFATSSDVIFEFDGFKWMAIMEDLFIPKDKLEQSTFLGTISDKYIDIFFNYLKSGEIDPKYTGLTIELGNIDSIRMKFRQEELKRYQNIYFISPKMKRNSVWLI